MPESLTQLRTNIRQFCHRKCNYCRSFTAAKGHVSYQQVELGTDRGCPGCQLLQVVIERYALEGNRSNAWLSMSAPSKFSALYQLFSHLTGALELFTTQDYCPLPTIPQAQRISGNTASDLSYSRAQGWLNHCVENHKSCRSEFEPFLPTRLLDLRSVNIHRMSGIVRLVLGIQVPLQPDTRSTNYACLSHCWGTGQMLKTTLANIASHESGMSLDIFPKTFQDAILFTLQLGVFYIWIDSLCIIQDSSEDWENESKQMANIYAQGHFTIAASKASSSDEGCFSVSPSKHLGEEIRISHPSKGISSVWVRRPIDHNTWPLLKRAWVYQERLLSRRIVHFTNEEVVWECMDSTECECSRAIKSWGPYTSVDRKSTYLSSSKDTSRSALSDQWRDVVSKYSSMCLTFEKDIFPALSGLAKAMQVRGVEDEYYAGTWKKSVIIDMLWRLSGSSLQSETRPNDWRAPSWSWASVKQKVTYETNPGRELKSGIIKHVHVRLVAAECTLAGSDPHGQITSGYVTLEGHLASATPYVSNGRIDGPYLRIGDEDGLAPQWDDTVRDGKLTADLGETVHLLKMVTTTTDNKQYDVDSSELICLVLQAVDESMTVFRRVGYISRFWPEKDQWFRDSAEETRLTII